MATFSTSLKSTLIYIFAISDEYHRGCLKIGETTLDDDVSGILQPNDPVLQKAARRRIDQYTQTAGIAYNLLWTELTVFFSGGCIKSFNDKAVHRVLERSGIRKKVFDHVHGANEWYCCDLATARMAIKAVKEGRASLNSDEVTHDQSPIIFRPEQQDAIRRTVRQFRKGKRMLWNAKMRFGKTLCGLQVVKEMQLRRTLIITHRPVVDEGWFDDFQKIFYDSPHYHYGSRTKGESFDTLQRLDRQGDSFVYFVSMQDMRESEAVGGKFAKNADIFATQWDLLIIDEAHEGTKTELGSSVIDKLTKEQTRVLQLSGTPFNLLDDYKENEIFTWDYIMEQRAKTEWDLIHMGDPNPYASLPAINIYTYDLGSLLSRFADDEKAFNFREFFRTRDDDSFIYDADIDSFLDLLCSDDADSLYPYSNKRFRAIFRHTLWVLPGVSAARALSRKLQAHRVFSAFHVVNVAGNGDEDEENEDALKLVNDAIGPDPMRTWTITLSCGKLTTGVSIKPWTAVFMMAGSYSTSAASYMQTIFRVQTPFSWNGQMKTECYAFDFAPDRTLRVLAEAAHVSAKAGKQTEEDRRVLGEFLNFCPVISIEGSRMKPYDVKRMMGQLKRAQIDRVVRDGFEDGALYSDELLKLTDVDLTDFDRLKGIIGKTRAMEKTADIDVNSQGLTNEEYEEREQLERKPKRSLTPEELNRLEELKHRRTQRQEAISILRGISIRMPLLIYGAELKSEDDDITIDNFAELIDERSWEEFMPTGVTKEVFNRFKRYYDPDIFREAGRRIREMARAADKFTIEERIERIATIFNTFRNPDKETVLTPWRVVNMHISDCLGGYCFYDKQFNRMLENPRYVAPPADCQPSPWTTESCILEINSKSGLYPLYCAYTIYRARVKAVQQRFGEINHALALMLWKQTIEQNIFVVCKTPMAVSITKRTLAGFTDIHVNAQYYPNLIDNLSQHSAVVVNTLRDGRFFWHFNNEQQMKFTAVVGNPPYQVMDGGAKSSSTPVYNLFVELANQLHSDYVSMIIPARWYAGGKGLDEFRDMMLNDSHISILYDFFDATYIFPNIDLSGGVCYYLHNSNYNNTKSHIVSRINETVSQSFRPLNEEGAFIRFNEVVSVINKIKVRDGYSNGSFEKLVSSRKPFGISTNDAILTKKSIDCVDIYAYPQNGYYYREAIKINVNWIDAFKVFISYAYGERGAFPYFTIGKPFIGKPGTVCSETYLVIAPSKSEFYVENVAKYLRTRFVRTLILAKKNTQHATSKVYAFVPLQDFNTSSDIDWSESVADIDRQLYAKYGLSDDEVAFIERTIKPME